MRLVVGKDTLMASQADLAAASPHLCRCYRVYFILFLTYISSMFSSPEWVAGRAVGVVGSVLVAEYSIATVTKVLDLINNGKVAISAALYNESKSFIAELGLKEIVEDVVGAFHSNVYPLLSFSCFVLFINVCIFRCGKLLINLARICRMTRWMLRLVSHLMHLLTGIPRLPSSTSSRGRRWWRRSRSRRW